MTMSKPGSVKLSVFQQLASQVLSFDGKDEVLCNIPVRKLDGASSQVRLRVRQGEPAKPQAATEEAMGLNYLDTHQLNQRVQKLVEDIVREQPEDPYRYMVQQLRKTKEQEGKSSNVEPKSPLVPKPPGGSAPSNRPQRPSDGEPMKVPKA
eukprot:gnl/TRDRNA2_/TRDRNA2_128078_c0_seq1.p1 gnl/TRDRNA2_/TRDRNA2_128078_c0~~gnl/TRDRNA2_/TRDRNA2_128078_c0_seq1.p1  ORF type:complete len:151 (-),score=28.51 gnl/TRDRNA2_/TRDRNA2_128078_c0_seq1:184-636(-)